ncbi:MAG: peptide deformylase [Alphaproteobacteria bacterium]
MALSIHYAPDPVLQTKSTPIDVFDDDLRALLDEMVTVMYREDGMGLAANQVGITKRFVIVDIDESGENPDPRKMVNPEITWASDKTIAMNESCISLPGIYPEVVRPEEVEVSYQDEFGEKHTIKSGGIIARCLQHEIDHLDGKLSIDYQSPLRRKMLMRKLIKNKRIIERKKKQV